LEGMNQYFEELKSNNQDLKFEALKKGNILSNKEILKITGFKKDKNLKLLKSLIEKNILLLQEMEEEQDIIKIKIQ